MTQTRIETLLSQVNAALTNRNSLIRDRQKRLFKADSRETAEALKREIITLDADVELLKSQQKALKRGIIPDDLVDAKEPA